MRHLAVCMTAAAVLASLAGCGVIGDLLQPTTVTVRLVNNGDFDVDVVLYISGNQDVAKALLTSLGDKIEYTVGKGETVTFSRDCDDLQAIIVDKADLKVLGGIGPEAESDVLRDGDDFGCGDTITFTFDHSLVVLDFDVTVTVTD
ncbi:MAG: hypothetical protein JXQ73_23535 [Phycisphaerae bacterium]|nr:hypothetical protein [Phycisphaerae bacterium]